MTAARAQSQMTRFGSHHVDLVVDDVAADDSADRGNAQDR
jgi:hypothetical protein